MVAVLIFYFVSGFVLLNIAPFFYSDTFGHYMRSETTYYVYCYKKEENHFYLSTTTHIETIRERVNPWLNWWGLAKYKPCTYKWVYENEEVKEMWRLIHGNEL
jgi:hypothetical protein